MVVLHQVDIKDLRHNRYWKGPESMDGHRPRYQNHDKVVATMTAGDGPNTVTLSGCLRC